MIFRRSQGPRPAEAADIGPVVAEPADAGMTVAEAADRGPVDGAPVDVDAEIAALRAERLALIELCLYARDRVSSNAAGDRIDAGLIDLGITPLRPEGEPFDPALHEAAATVPTDDPALHDTVAETEVPGYADRGVVVRPPVVSVYRMAEPRVARS